MRSKRLPVAVVALLVGLAVVWWVGSPYLTLYRLRAAVIEEDEEALREIVDFPPVRADLAEDLQGAVGPEIEERLGDPGLGGLGRLPYRLVSAPGSRRRSPRRWMRRPSRWARR